MPVSRLTRRASALCAAILFMVADPCAQPASGTDLAERTFRNAEQLLREGKKEQAVKDFEQVVQAYPDTAYAPEALARLGTIFYPVAGIWDLGTVNLEDQGKARTFFEQIREQYPRAESAPHAMYSLGLLALEPRSPRRNLDEAYASFFGVVNIYPGSKWGGAALQGAAVSEMWKQAFDKAIIALERAMDETPEGETAGTTQYFLGVASAREKEYVRAASAFQAARLVAPGTRAAHRSLRWLSLVYNTRLRSSQGGSPRYSHDSSFVPRPAAGSDLRGDLRIRVGPGGTLAVADPKAGTLSWFAEDGKLERSEPFPEVLSAEFDALGLPIIWSATQVTIDGEAFVPKRKDKKGPQPIEEIGGVWRNSKGSVYVTDVKEGQLLRYRDNPEDESLIYSDKEAGTRMGRSAAGPLDDLYFIDEKGSRLLALGKSGLTPLAGTGSTELEEPVDLDVDRLGNIYVLDSRLGSVIIFSPDGGELARIAPEKGSLAELSDPASVAVGPGGEVYVYDKKKRTILRFN